MKPSPLLAISLASALLLAAALCAQAPPAQAQAAPDSAQAKKAAADSSYQSGLDDINSANWYKALDAMSKAEADMGKQGDGAMYWQAYAEAKLARTADALAALDKMQRNFPDSSWKDDADALALQLRQASGQNVSPTTQPNDDLKLLAINGLMQSDAAQALPLLEKVVESSDSPAVKSRALFVMAQNHSPEAVNDLVAIAQAHGDPKLGLEAVRYLGMMGGDPGRAALGKIYTGSSDPEVKSAILRSYMIGGDRARLLATAKSETDPQLQADAIRYLALAGGKDELWQLYQTNPSKAGKQEIIRALGVAGDLDHLIPLAKSETAPELRADAIRSLGLSGSPKAQDALVAMYTGAGDRTNSQAIIGALFIHNSAAALVGLARKETDPDLKRLLVQRISLMHSPVATQYLMEILNQ